MAFSNISAPRLVLTATAPCPQELSRWQTTSQSGPERSSTQDSGPELQLTEYNYKQPARQAKRAVSAEKGEPPGENNGKKKYHLNFVQHWWCSKEVLAEAECRPLTYTLIHEPPAPDSGQIQQANGAKLLALYRHILELFDADDQSVPGVNTQTDKTMLGFFEDLLAAQFADCPKDLQGYATLDAVDKDAIKAVAKQIDTKVRERITRRDAYSETLGAALTEQDMLKYYNMTVKQMKGYNWANIMSLKAIFAHMFLNATGERARSGCC